jgi:tetratricopeptide (TPR) repeat protein
LPSAHSATESARLKAQFSFPNLAFTRNTVTVSACGDVFFWQDFNMIGQQPPPKNAASADGWDQHWRVAGLCLMLAAITFAVFGQTKGFSFVNLDDDVYVYENAKVAGGLSLEGLAWVFTHVDCSLYHPLTMLSLMADYQLHGLHAGGYHLTNVLLHTASVILLFLVLRQMTGALWRSAFVAALFAIHPLRVESVAWVAERKDVLSGFFFMLTLGAYVQYVRKPNSLARYLMVAIAFVLALLSKPTVVTLPFVLLLLDYWPLNRFEQPGKLSRLLLEKVPLLALAAGACAMTVLAAGNGIAARAHVTMLSRLGNALVSCAVYLRQMVWPEGLAVFYPQPEKGHPLWTTALSLLVLALITGGVLAFGRKRRWLLTGWLWYLGMLTPMIGLVQTGSFAYADRMTYLPQIGLYLLLAWAVAELSADWSYRRAALGGLAAIILVALIFCARTQTAYWRDSETLWNRALACTTGNFVAENNLGNALLKKGRVDEAILCFQKALQIKPGYAEAHNNLGNALFQKGRVDEAIVHDREALRIWPDSAEAHFNLGLAIFQKGKVDEAIVQFQGALKIKPGYAAAHYALANALRQRGKVDEAISHYQRALHIKPDFAEAHNNLGTALRQKGRVDEAIAHYQEALEMMPENESVHVNLANAFLQKGRVGQAIGHYQRALQIDPADMEIQNNLAWLLATSGQASLRNGDKAVQLARRANELAGGTNPVVLGTLAAAFAEAGQFGDARRSAQEAIALARAAGRPEMVRQLNDELQLYEAGRPFHRP